MKVKYSHKVSHYTQFKLRVNKKSNVLYKFGAFVLNRSDTFYTNDHTVSMM